MKTQEQEKPKKLAIAAFPVKEGLKRSFATSAGYNLYSAIAAFPVKEGLKPQNQT